MGLQASPHSLVIDALEDLKRTIAHREQHGSPLYFDSHQLIFELNFCFLLDIGN